MTGSRAEGFGPERRLRRRLEFLRCYRGGRRRHGAHLNLLVHRNELGHPRLGLTVPRRVGRAVTRNRIKRRIREIFRRQISARALGSFDLVLHAKPGAGELSFDELRSEVFRLIDSVGSRRGR